MKANCKFILFLVIIIPLNIVLAADDYSADNREGTVDLSDDIVAKGDCFPCRKDPTQGPDSGIVNKTSPNEIREYVSSVLGGDSKEPVKGTEGSK